MGAGQHICLVSLIITAAAQVCRSTTTWLSFGPALPSSRREADAGKVLHLLAICRKGASIGMAVGLSSARGTLIRAPSLSPGLCLSRI